MRPAARFVAVTVWIVTIFSSKAALDLSDPARFKTYDIPPPFSVPCDICEGSDKSLWGIDVLTPKIFRLRPATGQVDVYDIPFTSPALNFTPPPEVGKLAGKLEFGCAIRPGYDGRVYFSLGSRGQIGGVDVVTGDIEVPTLFNVLGGLEPFNDLTSGPTGIYFTLPIANKIAFFSFKTRNVTYYIPPTPNSLPMVIYYSFTDGFVYFAQVGVLKIGMLNPGTGEIKEFFVGFAGAAMRVETPSGGKHPYLWVTTSLSNGVARFNPENGEVKNFQNPLFAGFASSGTIDKCEIIWFSDLFHNSFGRIDSKTEKVSYVTIPGTGVLTPVSVPPFLVFSLNYGPGNAIWFTKVTFNQIGRYELDANCSTDRN